MFICDFCHKPSQEKTSPTFVVVEERNKSYFNRVMNPETEVLEDKFSYGHETIKELKKCVICMGHMVPSAVKIADTFNGQVVLGQALQVHGRGCGKPLFSTGTKKDKQGRVIEDGCKTCQRALDTYRSIPSSAMSSVLQDKLAQPARFSMATLLLDSMVVDRSTHNSKRAKRDLEAAIVALKQYETRGGKL